MFIARREDGSVYGCWTVRQWVDQEEVADDHPDVLAFRAPMAPIDLSDLNNIEKGLKVLALCVAQLNGITEQQLRTLFKQKWGTLP